MARLSILIAVVISAMFLASCATPVAQPTAPTLPAAVPAQPVATTVPTAAPVPPAAQPTSTPVPPTATTPPTPTRVPPTATAQPTILPTLTPVSATATAQATVAAPTTALTQPATAALSQPTTASATPASQASTGGQLKLNLDEYMPKSPARDLLLHSCTGCHSFVPIITGQRTKQRWENIRTAHRDAMLALNINDYNAIYDYLSENFNDTKPEPKLPDWFVTSQTGTGE